MLANLDGKIAALIIVLLGAAPVLTQGQDRKSTKSDLAKLTIEVDKPLHGVSPMLYGLMTEEINFSYDGGLYPEMVRNRTFHDGRNDRYRRVCPAAGSRGCSA